MNTNPIKTDSTLNKLSNTFNTLSVIDRSINQLRQKIAELEDRQNNATSSLIDLNNYGQPALFAIRFYLLEKIATLFEKFKSGKFREGRRNAFLIFTIEFQVRRLLEVNDVPNINLHCYHQIFSELGKRCKAYLRCTTTQFTFQDAALKGQAAFAFFKDRKNAAAMTPVFYSKVKSHNQVIVTPKLAGVYKFSSNRSRSEQELIESLFSFYSSQATTGYFDCRGRSAIRCELSIDNDEKTRSRISLEDLRKSDHFNKFFGSLISLVKSPTERMILHATFAKTTADNLKVANEMSRKEWFIWSDKLPKEERIEFDRLKYLILMNQIQRDTKIAYRSGVEAYKTLDPRTKTGNFTGLNQFNLIGQPSFYMVPVIYSSAESKAYKNCESTLWSYRDEKDMECVTTFSNMHRMTLEGQTLRKKKPVGGEMTEQMMDDFSTATSVGWKIVFNELLFIKKDGILTTTENFQVKPYIDNLLSFHELSHYPKACEEIFKRFTPKEEYNCVLTGLFQCLDLHGGNIGVAPLLKSEQEDYKDLVFKVREKNCEFPFLRLAIAIMEGTIDDESTIEFSLRGRLISNQLIDLPELKNALNLVWELQIYDTDLSIADDNILQSVKKGDVINHNIPLRSAFLESSWKDLPLQNETVSLLLQCGDMNTPVREWMKRSDAPIRKRLSSETLAYIDQFLEPILVNYDLSKERQKANDFSISDLRQNFVAEITNVQNPAYDKFWGTVEAELGKNRESTLDVMIKWRNRMAHQLFPRMTIRQQRALIERQERLERYLINYSAFKNSTVEAAELLDHILQYLNRPETPLSSSARKKHLEDLCRIQNSPNKIEVDELHQSVCSDCVPSYFNTMKALYPLLADAYFLYSHTSGQMRFAQKDGKPLELSVQKLAGSAIGHFEAPLDEAIEIVKKDPNSPTELLETAERLQNEITFHTNPSFFFTVEKKD